MDKLEPFEISEEEGRAGEAGRQTHEDGKRVHFNWRAEKPLEERGG